MIVAIKSANFEITITTDGDSLEPLQELIGLFSRFGQHGEPAVVAAVAAVAPPAPVAREPAPHPNRRTFPLCAWQGCDRRSSPRSKPFCGEHNRAVKNGAAAVLQGQTAIPGA